MSSFKYEIIKKLGVLSENTNGWKREVNLISWNERPAKIDIRDWDPNNEKMSKGITLSDEEAENLLNILKEIV